jgi:hypothetical protein
MGLADIKATFGLRLIVFIVCERVIRTAGFDAVLSRIVLKLLLKMECGLSLCAFVYSVS